jgi:hypothetical protein
MNQPDDEQIKPERFNMKLLDFLVNRQYLGKTQHLSR